MRIRTGLLSLLLSSLAFASGCRDSGGGPIVVSAIGGSPKILNPNREPLDPPSALLIESTAQGLVRFDAIGQVEPALAESWIVSDDGLRYTFRIQRTSWGNGKPVTAPEVAARLKAAIGRASRNPLKPLLGAVLDVQAMTDNVLEISLKAPRTNFLQLLAQPELAVIRDGGGTGPYRATSFHADALRLAVPREEDEEPASDDPLRRRIILRGESAALAVARFDEGEADWVTGGTANDLLIARASSPRAAALRFDPVEGLFGLAFLNADGPLASPAVRQALSMAVDRESIPGLLGVADLATRTTIAAPGITELPSPSAPDWSAQPLAQRRAIAARIIAGASGGTPVVVRVSAPDGPGNRILLALLRRDWRAIGVETVTAAPGQAADLQLVDQVAAANLATWYLRHFSCEASAVCSPEADRILDAARIAPNAAARQPLLAEADRALSAAVPFIPLASPVRWSLVSPRLTGFQPNPFGRRFIGSLVAGTRQGS